MLFLSCCLFGAWGFLFVMVSSSLPLGYFCITLFESVGWSTPSECWTCVCLMRIDLFKALCCIHLQHLKICFSFVFVTYLKSSRKHVAGVNLLFNSAFDWEDSRYCVFLIGLVTLTLSTSISSRKEGQTSFCSTVSEKNGKPKQTLL